MDEHLPCPFCDDVEPVIASREFFDYEADDASLVRTGSHWAVACTWCGARGPEGESEEEAWRLWDHGIYGGREDCAEALRQVGDLVRMERVRRELRGERDGRVDPDRP